MSMHKVYWSLQLRLRQLLREYHTSFKLLGEKLYICLHDHSVPHYYHCWSGLGADFTSNKIYRKTNFQYQQSDLYCDITLFLATTIDLQLRLWNRPVLLAGACFGDHDQKQVSHVKFTDRNNFRELRENSSWRKYISWKCMYSRHFIIKEWNLVFVILSTLFNCYALKYFILKEFQYVFR